MDWIFPGISGEVYNFLLCNKNPKNDFHHLGLNYPYLFNLDGFDDNLTGIFVAFLFTLLRIDQVKLKHLKCHHCHNYDRHRCDHNHHIHQTWII